ncbi:hypothetical protein [Marmoricola sp. RAF53]|uniref:hypothetical protein n=1 Tax=Marmoricola sp. RAF53 TaxID=3233059 RepID=UPI003F966692
MSRPAEYVAQVGAWAADLRVGGTATWAEFRAGDPAPGPPPPGPLPGSAQLEVVRRLALRAPDLPRFADLADLVLGTASPGRGLVDTPLPWADEPAFGTPAVEPELLPADELVRAAAAVLVRLLVDAPPAAATRPSRGGRWRRRGFVVLGAPGAAAAVRDALVGAGWREGGLRPTYLVLGGPLDDLMAERWAARVRAGAGMRWHRMWRTAATHDRVPPALRLPEIAGRLADQFGADRVHVVLGADPAAVLAGVGAVLGTKLGTEPGTEPGTKLGAPARADVTGTDLLRVLNPLLVLAAGEEGRRRVVAGPWASARAAVTFADPYAAGLGGPPGLRPWAAATARRMAGQLRAGDYAVHGDPDLLVPTTDRERPASVDPADVLELALGLVAELWQRASGGTA